MNIQRKNGIDDIVKMSHGVAKTMGTSVALAAAFNLAQDYHDEGDMEAVAYLLERFPRIPGTAEEKNKDPDPIDALLEILLS